MNIELYGKLIFELSHKGCKGCTLPENKFGNYELPEYICRNQDAELPECDELTVVRHYTNLSTDNFGVDNGFYPLGSCTMKYNPVVNDEISNMPAFTNLHPLQSEDTTLGARQLYKEMQHSLCEITGMNGFTLTPCAGAHGELTGLMTIRAFHESRNDTKRTKVIVPDSAHGTNPASAAVCGLEVVEVNSTDKGLVDINNLKEIISEQGDEIAAMMMTNPNTLGLFEQQIPEIAKMIHECGGMMYYDGANLNPMLGVCRPGDMGFDVMHINLHKTFSTPHGGGGPGSGPVGAKNGLEKFLPEPGVGNTKCNEPNLKYNNVGAFYGNYSIIIKAYAYILSLGREYIKYVGPLSVLNANYIKESLKDVYELPIEGLCKHEFVFNGLKDKSTGVTTMDVAKRLLDFGFHAPTIYFPLLFHEAMMIEPTENESKATLDHFIEVMKHIAEEAKNNPELVKTAPHNTPIGRCDDVLAARNPIVVHE